MQISAISKHTQWFAGLGLKYMQLLVYITPFMHFDSHIPVHDTPSIAFFLLGI
jgi:hypothetical protein